MNDDLMDRLATMRPAPPFPPSRRTATLEAILNADRSPAETWTVAPGRALRRRRLLVGAAVAGAAAGVALVVPVVLPRSTPGAAGSAAATELHRLAGVTDHSGRLAVGADDYWYVEYVTTQTGVHTGASPTSPAITVTRRSRLWTDRLGDRWLDERRTDPAGGDSREVDYLPGNGEDRYLAGLPTDATALGAYLRAHATGSSSVDEAVFAAVQPILQGGLASPQLRAAAVEVLAGTGHVSLTRDVADASGRSAERFDFVDPVARPDDVQSFTFDTDTAEVVATGDTQPGSTTVESVLDAHVVNKVPADVLDASRATSEGDARLGRGAGG